MSSTHIRGKLYADGDRIKLRTGAADEVALVHGGNLAAITLTLPVSTDTLVGRDTTDTLTNKSLSDSTTYFIDNSDSTKKLQLQLSGITTATTRTLTVQDSDGTLAITANKLSAFAATTSAELAGVISDETGSGALVFANTPTLITPVLGVATATSINGLTITTSTGTLTITNGKTLSVSNTLTFTGTDSTSFAFPSTSDTVVTLTATQTLTNKTLTSPTIGDATNIVAAGLATIGVVTASAQSFGGQKTFGSAPIFSALTASTVPYLDASKVLTSSAVTPTQLGYLSGATGTTGTTTTNLVFSTSPTLVTPILGTPTSGTLTNCTGLPVSSGISGFGTGVATALGNAVNTSGGVATSAVTSLSSLATVGTITSGTWNAGAVTSSSTLTATTSVTAPTSVITPLIKAYDANGLKFQENGGTENGSMSDAGAWTLGVDQSTQTQSIYGTLTARGYASGSSIKHLFENKRAANDAGGSVYAKLSSYSSDAGIIFAPDQTEKFTLITNTSGSGSYTANALGFYASGTFVGQVTQNGQWVLGNSTMTTNHFARSAESTQVMVISGYAATASSTRRLLDARYETDTDCTGGYFYSCLNSSSTVIGRIEAASNTTTSFTGSSDARLKQNPTDFNGLDIISQILPREYEWKSNPGKRQKGFYAQELYEAYPDAVSIGSDELTEDGSLALPWGVDYGRLTPVLVKAVQELKAENNALVARIEALEGV